LEFNVKMFRGCLSRLAGFLVDYIETAPFEPLLQTGKNPRLLVRSAIVVTKVAGVAARML
jgi:hypothetical protein